MKTYFNQEEEVAFVPIITDAEGGPDLECPGVDEESLPILPLRNMTLFPGITLPVLVGRRTSLALVKEAFNNKKYIGVVCQKKADVDDPAFDDIYYMGSIAEIVKILDMPDGNTTVILQGKHRFKLLSLTSSYPYLRGKVELVDEIMTKNDNPEFMGLVSALKDLTGEFLKNLGDPSRELLFAVQNIGNPYFLINFLSANLPISIERKQALLSEDSIKERGFKLYAELSRETQFQEIKARKGHIIALINKQDTVIRKIADECIEIPETLECLEPLVTTIPLQLLAYHIAVCKGKDVDQPRNLAKSVTVE